VRRRLTAGLSALAVATGLLVTAPTASASTGGSSIDWQNCEDKQLQQADARCGFVEVPLDYSDPGGEQIKLRVSKIEGTKPDSAKQGVMLVNPGGPGGSGLRLPLIKRSVPQQAGQYYDWIGFDPRGVGASEPRLNCIRNYEGYNRPQYVPETDGVEAQWLARSEIYAKACAAEAPQLLQNMKTIDTVRDMDRIRAALGAEQLNYYGFSYGTYLGQVYATKYPDRTRRMVLDSNVDPSKVWYESNLEQSVAFDDNAQVWFEWLAEYNDVFGLGSTAAEVEQQWYRVRDALNEQAAGGLIGGAEWTDLFLNVGYSQGAWEPLGHLFADYVHNGDAEPLIEAYTPEEFDDNSYAAYLAVECTDTPWPQDWSQWRRDNWQTHASNPFETWGNAWFNAPCKFWQADAGEAPEVHSDQEALLISGTEDAATPYEGSLSVRERLPESRLIAMVGETTHAASLSGNECVDGRIAEYLRSGKLPTRIPSEDTADVVCSGLPDPVPDEQQEKAAETAAKSTARAVLRRATEPIQARLSAVPFVAN